MFAVLKTGGKQYRVQSGDVLRVEKLAADAGEKVQFNEILMVGATVGTPFVSDAAVQAELLAGLTADPTGRRDLVGVHAPRVGGARERATS